MNLIKYIKYIKYLHNIIYVNVKLKCMPSLKFPFFPLVVTSRIRLHCDPSVQIKYSPGSYLRLGYGCGGVASFEHTGINLELYDLSVVELVGISIIGYGSSISVYPNGLLKICGGTYLAGNTNIKCAEEISIGSNCAISWNVTLIDSDFHPWSVNGESREITKPIIIEDHVWIGSNTIILKGVTIGEGCIVGAGSVVTQSIPKNCLVVGNPAKIVQRNVSW